MKESLRACTVMDSWDVGNFWDVIRFQDLIGVVDSDAGGAKMLKDIGRGRRMVVLGPHVS